MTVVTRFAPSPTGFLHIGGARTALFNWLFARHHGGRFVLRIEDTDRKRSTEEALRAILDGLAWLGLDWDGETIFQSTRAKRHAELARGLLAEGKAYQCYATPEELADMRERARAEGRSARYDGSWRDRSLSEAPEGIPPAIRLRAPQEGETVISDAVQGEVRVANEQLDDMVLLRANGSPTYMLAVVVDDHDMEITHVIRGDEHLTNAARQTQLYRALGWEVPRFAHVPLIHGSDGAKLSKRHGALGVDAYRDMGYLPEALRNYLLRLGWSHGDDEIISTEQAVEWFELDSIGRSPARFDFAKLESVNAHYLRERPSEELIGLIAPGLGKRIGRELGENDLERLGKVLPLLKPRAKTLIEIIDKAAFFVANRPLTLDAKAARLLDEEARERLRRLFAVLSAPIEWSASALETVVRDFAAGEAMKLGQIAQPLRAALTGSTASPGIFEVLETLGREESLARIGDVTS